MGVNSLPRTVTRQRRGCDLNLGPTAPHSTLTTGPPTTACAVNRPLKTRRMSDLVVRPPLLYTRRL